MSYRTVAEMKQFAAQMLSESETNSLLAGDTTLGYHNMLESWLQRSFDRIATWKNWTMFEELVPITWTGGTSEYQGAVAYLPDWVARIYTVYPASTNLSVSIIPANDFDRLRPNVRNRDILVMWGDYGVEADNPSASTLTVTSSDGASDDGLQVRIIGLTNATPGYQQAETVTLAAGTATTSNTYKAGQGGVISCEIVPSTTSYTGIITIANGSTTLERLDATRERRHEHIRTELFAPIGGTGTYQCRVYRRPFRTTASTDIIPLPSEFQDILEILIMKQVAFWRGDFQLNTKLELEFRQRMREFSAWDNRRPGESKVLTVSSPWGARTN